MSQQHSLPYHLPQYTSLPDHLHSLPHMFFWTIDKNMDWLRIFHHIFLTNVKYVQYLPTDFPSRLLFPPVLHAFRFQLLQAAPLELPSQAEALTYVQKNEPVPDVLLIVLRSYLRTLHFPEQTLEVHIVFLFSDSPSCIPEAQSHSCHPTISAVLFLLFLWLLKAVKMSSVFGLSSSMLPQPSHLLQLRPVPNIPDHLL